MPDMPTEGVAVPTRNSLPISSLTISSPQIALLSRLLKPQYSPDSRDSRLQPSACYLQILLTSTFAVDLHLKVKAEAAKEPGQTQSFGATAIRPSPSPVFRQPWYSRHARPLGAPPSASPRRFPLRCQSGRWSRGASASQGQQVSASRHQHGAR